MKVKCQVCSPNFIVEREEGEKPHKYVILLDSITECYLISGVCIIVSIIQYTICIILYISHHVQKVLYRKWSLIVQYIGTYHIVELYVSYSWTVRIIWYINMWI